MRTAGRQGTRQVHAADTASPKASPHAALYPHTHKSAQLPASMA